MGKIKNFFRRMMAGLLLIMAVNLAFQKAGLSLSVGINPVTAIFTGTFGVPGVLVLYGISGCSVP